LKIQIYKLLDGQGHKGEDDRNLHQVFMQRRSYLHVMPWWWCSVLCVAPPLMMANLSDLSNPCLNPDLKLEAVMEVAREEELQGLIEGRAIVGQSNDEVAVNDGMCEVGAVVEDLAVVGDLDWELERKE